MRCEEARESYSIRALKEEAAERRLCQSLVHSRNVHVSHNGGKSCVGELSHKQLQGQATLLSTCSVMPVQSDKVACQACTTDGL